jgi:MarR family transcriptional regulator, transcriptional regulator for hemolysin
MAQLDLSFLLNQASYAFAARLAEALAGVGVSVREYCVLWKASEGERTQAEIATLAGLDKTTMVVTLDRLEQSGLAERQPSETDRRARVVHVTPRGVESYEQARVIVERVTNETLATLSPESRDGLVRALTELTGDGGLLATPSHVTPQRRKQVKARPVD